MGQGVKRLLLLEAIRIFKGEIIGVDDLHLIGKFISS